MATRAELEAALNNPNARKFLDLLSYTEGTQKNGYATAFGGGRIDDLSKHPRTSSEFTQTDGKKNTTTAAGRYMFLSGTWDEQAEKLGLSDFGAKSQDLAALSLAADSGALKSILSGNFKAAIDKTGGKWASLPSSPHPQGKKSWEDVNSFLGSNYTPSQNEQAQPVLNTAYASVALPDFSINSPSSIFGQSASAPTTAPLVQAPRLSSQQDMLETNFDIQQQEGNPFQAQALPLSYQSDAYQTQNNVQIADLSPIQSYMENVWDNTEILPQEYMNG